MKPLLAVLALALVLRVGLIVATPDFAPFGDPVDYDRIAVTLSGLGSFAPTGLADRPVRRRARGGRHPPQGSAGVKQVASTSTSPSRRASRTASVWWPCASSV